jgi:hypothetical protein
MAAVTATGGAEAEGDQQKLQAAILGDAAARGLQGGLEDAFFYRQPVEENDVEHDPADREEAGDGAKHGRAQRHVGRHREDKNGDEVGDDQRNDCRDVRLDLVGCDENEKREDRKDCRTRRKTPLSSGS